MTGLGIPYLVDMTNQLMKHGLSRDAAIRKIADDCELRSEAIEGLKAAFQKPLFIPLKREFYNQFAKGQKDTEYRPYGPRWNERTCPVGREVVLSLGYGKAHRMRGKVSGFERRQDVTQTRLWRSIYGTKHGQAACIGITIQQEQGHG